MPTRMDKVVIDAYYHMTPMDENVNWMKLTTMLSNFSLNPRVTCCTSNLISTFLIAFQNVHNKEKQDLSLMYTMYLNASNNTSFYTYVSSYML